MADNDRELQKSGDQNRVEGTAKDIKGRVKDAIGGLTGDESLQAEGKLDRVKGKAQDMVGEAQQKLGDR